VASEDCWIRNKVYSFQPVTQLMLVTIFNHANLSNVLNMPPHLARYEGCLLFNPFNFSLELKKGKTIKSSITLEED